MGNLFGVFYFILTMRMGNMIKAWDKKSSSYSIIDRTDIYFFLNKVMYSLYTIIRRRVCTGGRIEWKIKKKTSYFIKMIPTNTAVAANVGTISSNHGYWTVSFIGSVKNAVKRKSYSG